LGIGRALRPLTIRVPEPRDSVLDEEATVRIAADVDLWLPVLKPGAARAFDLALVIDTSPSMAAWLDVLRELRRVLEQLGAFRDVDVWRLLIGPAPMDRLALAPGDGPPTRYDPNVLRDPAGRRLILIASDCTAAPWRDNRARKLIATWGRTQPVAILQTLPPPFWRQTGLGFSSAVEVRAPRLGSPTAFLKAEFPAPDDAPEDDSVPTPILWLDDAPLASWARMLTRPGASSTAHWIEPRSLDPAAAQAAGMELPAEERVVRFARNASKIAQELAASLAVAPLTMPVIRLVQRTMRPPADDLYLAEVLLGGLMEVTSQSDETHNPTFEFHEGVRKRLLDRLGPARGLEVITAVSRYLVAHHGSTLDFAAIIDDPEGFLDRPTGEQDRPFAHITAMFLRRLGSRYARIADHLEGKPIPDTPAPGPAKPAEPAEATVRVREERTPLRHDRFTNNVARLKAVTGGFLGAPKYEQYKAICDWAKDDPEGFWGEAAEDIIWFKRWDKVLDDSNPPFYRWFKGGVLNTCYNAIDRHVEAGRGEQPAIIYDSPVTNTVQTITYKELCYQVARFAGALRRLGVEKGDRVVIYMPMIPHALVAMLACARLGAVHSVVFGGFAPHQLATRITDAKPRVVVSASCGIEPNRLIKYKSMVDAALEESKHKPERCIIFQRPQETATLVPGRDLDWNDAVADAIPADCVPVNATDPLYILYTAGRFGRLKGAVRDNGGHAVALKWTMKNFYNVDPGEVYWAASDIGWVIGHSYIVYAPLLHGCTTIVFEGKPVGTPNAGTFWRVIEQHKVPTLFTAPPAFRAIKREDPHADYMKKYDLSHFRALFLSGQRSDPDTLQWAEENLKVPVIDHWWQTETGSAICGNPLGTQLFPIKYGSAGLAMPGYDLRVFGPGRMEEVPRGETGAIYAKLPLPPGTLMTLWNDDKGFKRTYFSTHPGYYETGDAGFIDKDGYVYVMSRTDDIINVAGHPMSTSEMERILLSHPDVAECVVIGVADKLKGQVPLGFLVLQSFHRRPDDQIVKEVIQMVRDQIGPVADFKGAIVVADLPKTRTGMILRGTLQRFADQQDFEMPTLIDDPAILTEIADALRAESLEIQADFDQAIRLDPKDDAAYRSRGDAWRAKEEYDKAIADYGEAIRLDPKDDAAYHNRGLAWSAKGEYDKAIADYDEAIRLDPKYAGAYNNRGDTYRRKGAYDRAIADYDEAIRLKPKYAGAYNGRAWLWATCPDEKYRDGKKAVDSATRACELTDWKDANCLGFHNLRNRNVR